MGISPLNKTRLNNMKINRVFSTDNTRTVTKVHSGFAVADNVDDEFVNFFLYTEIFYDKLREQKHKIQDNLYNKQEKDNSHKILTKEEKELLDFIQKILLKFNAAIDNLKALDLNKKENNLNSVIKTISLNSRFLRSIGISSDNFYHLHVNSSSFLEEIFNHPNKLNQLLDPTNGVIRKIFDSFRKVII